MKIRRVVFRVSAALCTLLSHQSLVQAQNFVIEAEDFDFDGGQHVSTADAMPYYGGAYDGVGAIADVDYHRETFQSSPDVYRIGEEPNVPMSDASGFVESVGRGSWDVTANFRLGWLSGDANNWFNYTRNFPSGRYRVYAGMSWGDFSVDVLRGELHKVTGGVGTTSQTLQPLGEIRGDGAGGWQVNQRVPLTQSGSPVTVELSGPTTLRFTARNGDYDYLLFVPEGAPDVSLSPTFTEAVAGSTITLTPVASGEPPLTYQWRINGSDVTGATSPTLTLPNLTAANSGRYSVRVSNAHGSFESGFAVVRVYYPINIGDTVAPDVPLPGAGILVGSGGFPEEHYYRFSGTKGQLVYFEGLDGDDCSGLRLSLSPAVSTPFPFLFSAPLGVFCNPGPIGTFMLPETGAYNLTVSSPGFLTGTYSFRLVPPANVQTFSISLGELVNGAIDTADNVDVYEFSVDPPTAAFFSRTTYSPCVSGIRLVLSDPDGQEVFTRPLGPDCDWFIPGTYALNKSGTYRLQVVGGQSIYGETYAFQILPTTIQTHTIAIGDRVQPNQPESGAGLTESLGSLDIYLFQGSAGQNVYFHELADFSQCLGTTAKLESPSGQLLFFQWIDDGCSGGETPSLVTLPETGTYKITVWVGSGGTGPHSFEVLPSVGAQNFTLNLGETVKQDHPAPGAGFLDPNGASDVFTFRLDTDAPVAFLDLGSDGNALIWTLEQVSDPFSFPVFSDPMDGVGAGTIFLNHGFYRIRVTASSANPTASGKYRFTVRLNQAPVATNDRVTVSAGEATDISKPRLLSNDRDPDGDNIYFYYFLPSANGATIQDLGNTLRYIPPTGFKGEDTFTYFIFDAGWLVSNGATVAVTVK